MEVTIVILLYKDPSTSKEGGISHDDEGAAYIRKVKYRSMLKTRYQSGEGSFLFRTPHPGLVFSGEGSERGSSVGETRDKLAI